MLIRHPGLRVDSQWIVLLKAFELVTLLFSQFHAQRNRLLTHALHIFTTTTTNCIDNWINIYLITLLSSQPQIAYELIEAGGGGAEDILQVEGLSIDGLNNRIDSTIQQIQKNTQRLRRQANLCRELEQRRFRATHVNRKCGFLTIYIYMPWLQQICIAKFLFSYKEDLPESFNQTTPQWCKKSTTCWRPSLKNAGT